jgi:hypothetical protein
MNKSVRAFGLLVLALPGAAFAQSKDAASYVSLSLLSSSIQVACGANQRCDQHDRGGSLRVGTRLPDAYTLDLGGLQVDTVEVGYTAFGTGTVSEQVSKKVFVGTGTAATRKVTEQARVSPSAISLNLVSRATLAEDWAARVQLGLAMVATTVKYTEDGQGLNSVTENHLRPVLGLGLSWAVMAPVALTLDWEQTRYASDGGSGRVRAWRLGVQWTP